VTNQQSSNLAIGQGVRPLVIVLYDPAWPVRFAEIRAMIQRTIPGTYHSVEHVGSTSVPGMAAKPIIDVVIVMREGEFDRICRGLESLGYEYEGDKDVPGRESFRLRDAGLRAVLAEHHLYVCVADGKALRDHRDFRDFLLRHPEWVERLSTHKLALLSEYAADRYGYQEAKSPMVEQILRLARLERDAASSPPGPLSLRGEGETPSSDERAAGDGAKR
jgi:GrpB-like predicted nucleotidyltransferase (UPF0157 family)